jgi:recombination protein RecA
VETISSGSLGIDCIRVGGYQEEVIEIYGPESSGRTTLTLHAAEAQKQAELLLLMRNAFDRNYAEKLGVDENLIISQPDNGERH